MAKMTQATRDEKVSTLTSVLGSTIPIQLTEKSFLLAIDAFKVEKISFRSLDAFLLGVEIGKKLASASPVEEAETTEEVQEASQPKTRKKAGK